MAPRRRGLRQHLIEVTERLLVERGPDALTTRRIAREAGVADGLLYNHFADKDELILHALVARASALMREFRDAGPAAGAATVEANLERLAIAMFELQRGVLPLLVGLLGERALLERFLAAVHGEEIGGPDAVLRRVHDYLAEERRLGRLSDGRDAHVAGVLLFAISLLQATVAQFRPADAGTAGAVEELRPFTRFLAEALTGSARGPHEQRSEPMTTQITAMLAVEDAPRAADWYERALGATRLWSLGSVVGLEVDGAPFLLHEPTDTGFVSPAATGETTVRVEVFVDDPDALFHRALEAGADGATDAIQEHEAPWGVHRQGTFRDPFGHTWHIGDRSPLRRHPRR